MQSKFKSKHQRLILQCYPAGRATDKRPNPSELSYLLYYVSTRRAKLTKVGLFLEQKAQSDAHRGRAGNVQVTLDILKAIIERCPEDLNLFAKNVVSIMDSVLSANDLSLSQHASPVFDAFCKAHDTVLFQGDPLYVIDFQNLFNRYVVISKGSNPGPNALQWKLVGIESLRSIASSQLLSIPTGKNQIHVIIPLLLSCLPLDADGSGLLSLQSQIANDESRNRRTSLQLGESFGDQDIEYTAMQALRYFFDTSSTLLLKISSSATIQYILTNNTSHLWSATLLEIATKCVPVQTRFAVLTELVEHLLALPTTDIANQITTARIISCLLSSSVNMIGLSVIDILRSLLHLQQQTLKAVPAGSLHSGTPAPYDLIVAVSDCIVALASHIYYAAQVSDMITEILARCQHMGKPLALGSGVATPLYGSFVKGREVSIASSESNGVNTVFLLSSLKSIQSILMISSGKTGRLEKNHLSMITWEGTQYLLNHEKHDVQVAYAIALITFLENCKTHDSFLKSATFNVVAGPFGVLFAELYKLVTSVANKDQFVIGYHVVRSIIQHSDEYGTLRACALALALDRESVFAVSGDTSKQYSIEQGIALGSMSRGITYEISRQIEAKDLESSVADEIKQRQSQHIWYDPIDVFSSQSLEDALAGNASILIDSNNVHQLQPLEQEQLTAAVSAAIPDYQAASDQILHADFIAPELQAIIRVPTIPKSDSSDRFFVARARSLKQLNHRLQSLSNNGFASPKNSNKNTDEVPIENGVKLDGDLLLPAMSVRSRAGSVRGSRSIITISDIRRDFSPRVKDLKKAASGYNVRLHPPSINGNRYTTSLHSNRSSEFAGDNGSFNASNPGSPAHVDEKGGLLSASPVPVVQLNGNAHDALDVMSFLGSLKLESPNDRGRLV